VFGKTTVLVENPSLAFSKIVTYVMESESFSFQGIDSSAVIAEDALVGKNVAIGPHVVVSRCAKIGDGSVIFAGSYIGERCVLGKNSTVYPNVTIREKTILGENVIVHSGTVLGSDGFGFEQVDEVHTKIPQIGIVEIGDDVEIGSNVTIDRARFDKTRIGRGTKIDNLVQIAHNVQIGENCIIVAQVGISGSTIIEDNVILAGQAGLAGHLKVGKNAIVASQAGVTKSIPAGIMVSGYPAKEHTRAKKVNACLQRLPKLNKNVGDLEKRILSLEEELKKIKKG
ncbi:UDP-3-O-[3-hydroxymyristoyl] glucosamine N-acyltransferase, partial [hydrothermal vent metagenome]